MKTKKNKLSIEKFRIAELKRPEYIFGGNGDGDDDGTNDTNKEKGICVSNSKRYVIIKNNNQSMIG